MLGFDHFVGASPWATWREHWQPTPRRRSHCSPLSLLAVTSTGLNCGASAGAVWTGSDLGGRLLTQDNLSPCTDGRGRRLTLGISGPEAVPVGVPWGVIGCEFLSPHLPTPKRCASP